MSRQQAVSLLLRFGLAFAFIYGASSAFLRPDDWIGYFPAILKNLFSSVFLLRSWELLEVVLAVWLISGKRVFIPSLISVALLLVSGLANIGSSDMAFLGMALSTAALSLSIIHSPRPHAPNRRS